jgi:hypothetical protein
MMRPLEEPRRKFNHFIPSQCFRLKVGVFSRIKQPPLVPIQRTLSASSIIGFVPTLHPVRKLTIAIRPSQVLAVAALSGGPSFVCHP